MTAKILVIDDDADVRVLCRVNLEFEGFQVIEAASGAEGLDLAKSERPDLILLDVMMPELDGWEVMSALNEEEQTADVPIVMLTARSDEESQLKGWEEGILDYITKPFNPVSLVKYVEAALDRRSSPEEVKRRQRIVEKLRRMKELRTSNG
ncbi:MAG: response regulator transcription factor [Actinomycetota bacterium]